MAFFPFPVPLFLLAFWPCFPSLAGLLALFPFFVVALT
jgi:hypothetical protein